jgi:hypothetical protein
MKRKITMKAAPPAVREAFGKQFPQARVLGVSEEKAPDGVLYEVESEWNGRHYDVTFRPVGSLVSVEETVPTTGIPPAVAAALKREFPSAKVARAEKITEGGTLSCEFQLTGGPKREAKFSADGKLLESE